MAPRVRFELTTKWLTATYSTAELPGIVKFSATGIGGRLRNISGESESVNSPKSWDSAIFLIEGGKSALRTVDETQSFAYL